MIIRTLKKLAKVSMLTMLATGLFATVGIASASANQLTCAPNLMEYFQDTLIVQCNGQNYYGQVHPPAGCPNTQVVDTLKAWQSLSQGALLSGKSVQIYFTPAAGACSNSISALDLIK